MRNERTATVITASGESEKFHLRGKPSARTLQKTVEGKLRAIDVDYQGRSAKMFVNDNSSGLRFNRTASRITGSTKVFGDAVVVVGYRF